MNAGVIATETVVACSTSFVVSEAANLDALWTALITFAVTVVTMVGGEVIKYLVAFFKKKTHDIEKEDKEIKTKEK